MVTSSSIALRGVQGSSFSNWLGLNVPLKDASVKITLEPKGITVNTLTTPPEIRREFTISNDCQARVQHDSAGGGTLSYREKIKDNTWAHLKVHTSYVEKLDTGTIVEGNQEVSSICNS